MNRNEKKGSDVDVILAKGKLNYNPNKTKEDIERFWGEESEILFPITFGEIRRANPNELGFLVTDISDSKIVFGRWVFNPPISTSGDIYILPASILEKWLNVYKKFPLNGIAARFAKDKIKDENGNDKFYVYFHLMKIELEDGGTGGDNIKVGIKVP